MGFLNCPAGVLIIIGIIYVIYKMVKELDVQTYASQAKKYSEDQMEYNALHFEERCEEIMRHRREKYNSLNGNDNKK